MATINLALNVQVVGGPKILISKSKSVEAYDKIEVVIEPVGPGGAAKIVEVQPGGQNQVSFLLINSSLYGAELTYVVNDGMSDSDSITLDEPHLYLGSGAVSLLGSNGPKTIAFTNTHPTDSDLKAAIEILVGRDATPPTP
ncbi:MAG TPA: hypothetical protein DDZ80_23595 [Cyanobacteria bacterium UBA8803]|nr:hypothetical protein [Cyanobacteria bacterium UBA9273]HBL61305.1 hypothetical protein [Cyanobacteria bacterium UBA8803]